MPGTQPTKERRRRITTVLVAVAVGLTLVSLLVHNAVAAYHFSRHAVVVDARIIDSDLGCFGAFGSGSTTIGDRKSITYEVVFPRGPGSVQTSVERPCGVIPPDFGRGRGSIWVEYDREDPTRIRVLNDHRVETDTRTLSLLLGAYLAILLGWASHRGINRARARRNAPQR